MDPSEARDIEAIRLELAPTGTLRAAINLGNPVLARKGEDGNGPSGVSCDLARELSQRTGLPLALIAYEAAGRVFEALDRNEWDVAFLAIEPVRAEKIHFTQPYATIEGTYLVRAEAPFRSAAELDRAGHRIVVATNAAYDLFLTRTLRHAEIVRLQGGHDALQYFLDTPVDAAAGIRQALETFAADKPDLRLLPDRFMAIEQAVATPRGRTQAAAYLDRFVTEMKASGRVRTLLDRNGQPTVPVPGAADAPSLR